MTGTKKGRLVIPQPRDLALFREMPQLVLVDRVLAMPIAGFSSITRVNARLLLLVNAGYLTRRFVGTIFGGRKAVYALTEKGALAAGIDPSTLQRRTDRIRQGELYFEHQLALNRFYVSLRFPEQANCGIELIGWKTFFKPVVAGLPLIPDALCELATPAGRHSCFVEVDLGTETRKVWQGKAEAYFTLAVSGAFQKHFQHSQFRVIVLTMSLRRIRHLQMVIHKRTDKLFFLTDFASLYRDGLLAPIWFRPSCEQQQPFA